MICLENINYKYRTSSYSVLNDFSIHIQRGDVVLLSGENGSGKTTLLRIIAGLIPKFSGGDYSGSRKFEDQNYDQTNITNFGMSFHGNNQQFIQERVDQEFIYILENQKFSSEMIMKRILSLAEDFSIQHLMERKFSTLSSGEAQLVKIALAFVLLPKVILMDEPFAYLDEENKKKVVEALMFLKNKYNFTYIISDHRNDGWEVFGASLKNINLLEKKHQRLDIVTSENHASKKTEKLLCKIENVDFSYSDRKSLISKLNYSICSGEFIVVVGGNGSGKTTLLNILMGRLKPLQGKITQTENLKFRMLANPIYKNFFSMKVKDEFELNTESGIPLNIFELEEFKERYVFDVSQGEQRKIALELISSGGADVILLDEPFLHLDSNSRKKVLVAIQKLNDLGVAVVATSHTQENLKNFSDQVWFVGEK